MNRNRIHRTRRLLPVILVFLSGFQCAHLRDLIKQPEVKYDTVHLKNINFTDATAVFRFNVYNPNSIGMRIREIGYNLDLNGSRFISGILQDGLHVPASGASVFEVPVTIIYNDFFKSVQSFLEADSLDYDLGGHAVFSMFRVPYKKTGRLPVPKLPSIRLKQFHVQEINLTGAKINAEIGLKNSNSFAIVPGIFEYTLSLADIRLSSGRAEAVELPGNNEEFVITIPLDLNFFSIGTALASVLSGRESTYLLDGSFHFKDSSGREKVFPVQSKGKVDLR